MGKKGRGKTGNKSAAYKPNLARPPLNTEMQKLEAEPSKRAKKQDKKQNNMGSEDSEEIDKRSKVKITDEMFEAAKLMKKGVSHIKDLDFSLVKRDKSLVSQTVGSCEVTIIDIFTGEVKMAKV